MKGASFARFGECRNSLCPRQIAPRSAVRRCGRTPWLGAIMALGLCSAAHAGACADLKRQAAANVFIASAVEVPAGPFTRDNGAYAPIDTPATCRVSGAIQPSADSDIRFEVWLPVNGWNRKLQGVGNGGFAGSISYRGGLVEAVRHGYAAVSTDTGHQGGAGDSAWAKGHPEKIVDYGWRAIHLAVVTAKSLATAYYGRNPEHAYFASCSNGGREALMEAQRFPEDYDGIIAGAPANNFTGLIEGFGWDVQALWGDPSQTIPPERTAVIAAEVLRQCDAIDGVRDGLLTDPRRCRFDPAPLLCGAHRGECLTQPQINALRSIYTGAHDKGGRQLFPGWSPGGEAGELPGWGWDGWIFSIRNNGDSQAGLFQSFMRDFATGDDGWTIERFDLDRDGPALKARFSPILDATNPDLSGFIGRGGKLILFHGWSDAAIAPQNTIDYYDAVRHKVGPEVANRGVRLFMVPGLQHCFGGPGPNNFGGLMVPLSQDPGRDLSAALERWVSGGPAPETVVAARYANFLEALVNPGNGKLDRTGLLCAYPNVARWTGKGSPREHANFVCSVTQPKKAE